jgi:hypothetical protein
VLPENTSFITDEISLRKLHHLPMSRATDKVLRTLDQQCRFHARAERRRHFAAR